MQIMGKSAQIKTEAPPDPEFIAIEAESGATDNTIIEASCSTDEAAEVSAEEPPIVAEEIVAIGKTVSNANGTILKGALDNLLKVAVTSCVLSESELLDMFFKYTKVAEKIEDGEEADEGAEAIGAGALTDATKSRVWLKTFDTTVECFTSAVRELNWCGQRDLTDRYQTDDLKKIYSG